MFSSLFSQSLLGSSRYHFPIPDQFLVPIIIVRDNDFKDPFLFLQNKSFIKTIMLQQKKIVEAFLKS